MSMHNHPLLNIRKHYTGQRRFYPALFGVVFWIAWLLSAALGPGNYDMAGNIVATDYMMGYSSGQALSEGLEEELFDYDAQAARQAPIIGEDGEASFSFNLPILQWIYVPFAQLPYMLSVVAWSVFGLGLLAGALRLFGALGVLPLALTFIPVYSNFTFGQNAFISLAILAGVFVLWRNDRHLLAGITLGLLIYKPQLVTGVGLLWLLNARRDWRALVGFGIGAGGLLGLMFGLMPEATSDYLDFVRNDVNSLAEEEGFPTYHMHNPRGFFELLIPPIADPLWLIVALAGVGGFIYLWRNHGATADQKIDHAFWFAAAVLLTLWATPHALVYDWTLLLIPAILLWQARPDWHDQLASLYIWGWITYAISLPITLAQQAVLPIAVQLSVVFLALALYALVRLFLESPKSRGELGSSGNHSSPQEAVRPAR